MKRASVSSVLSLHNISYAKRSYNTSEKPLDKQKVYDRLKKLYKSKGFSTETSTIKADIVFDICKFKTNKG